MKSDNSKILKICIVGVGKAGSALYHSLKKLGYNFYYAVDKNHNRLKIITAEDYKIFLKNKISKDCLLGSDVIIFAVPEKSLKDIVKKCQKFKLDLRKKILFHLSGVEVSDIFLALKVNKKNIGSFHPLQTFNTITYNYNKILQNIYFGIEGGENAVKLLREYCRSLKSRCFMIPKEKKILYHSACVIASNFMVSHFNIVSKVLDELSLRNKYGIEIFRPIISKTVDNIFSQGVKESLTGPFERGDSATINLHLKYIKEKLPSLLYYYISHGIEATNLSKERKSITKKEAREIEKLFLNYI